MRLRLLPMLAVAMSWSVSCGDADKLDITMRSRDGFGDPPTGCTFWLDELHAETTTECVATPLERQWVDADGRPATSPTATGPVYFSSYLRDPVVCNGHPLTMDESWFKWSADGGDIVRFDDGDAVTLYDERAIAIVHLDYVICSEATGTWRGTAGSLLGRTGTYRMVYDSIQTVLHLIED
jgi:hypothetical protein